MKIVLVTLANPKCAKGQQKVTESAMINGIDTSISWSWEKFKESQWYKDNKSLFDEKRGLGYWSWKPFIILDALSDLEEDDVVLYHDSGRPCYDWNIKHNVRPFVKHIQQEYKGLGIVFGPWNHGRFCKRDCLKMMDSDHPRFTKHKQVSATWSFWTKNTYCISILEDWKNWCCDPSRIVTDDKNKNEEHLFFDTHRHDQSILTNILLKQQDFKPLRHKGYEKQINNILSKFAPLNEPKKKYIFISIPKNASKSVFKSFGYQNKDHSKTDDIGIMDNHARWEVILKRYGQEEFDTRYKFCFVRNPWDRCVSWFYYHKNTMKLHPYKTLTFKEWVMQGCPHHWKRQNGTNYELFGHSPLDQWHFVCDNDDNILVDFVGRYETFSTDFQKICKHLNITSEETHINKTRNRTFDYMSEYDLESFEKIREIFQKDISLFGYGETHHLKKENTLV